jgi:hypothetical protein
MFNSRKISVLGGDKFRDDYSMYFDATNDNRVNCGSDSTLDVTTSDMSVSVWCKAVDGGGSKDYWPVVAKGNSLGTSGDGWAINIFDTDSNPGRIYLDTIDGSGTRQTANTSDNAISLNVWSHIVGTVDNSNNVLKLYINGSLIATNSSFTTADIADGSNSFYIGNDQDSRDFKGHISDVAFYKGVALSQADIYTLYNGREPYNHKEGIASTYLKGWWRMGDGAENGSGSTVYDMSGNGNDGTVENGPVFSGDII